ncbi:TetR/AcrR family transcriptional regulator [Streptomyces sp. NPDC005426]|uniref:TetR/AcrR family transcriptional regulator n=1 Tax=Streptomyces sp. NPDC005426 TaxID=3155344 RepID=UPI0033BF84DF
MHGSTYDPRQGATPTLLTSGLQPPYSPDGTELAFVRSLTASVTMDALAQRLECSTATLYSLAATKEQLVVAATRAFFKESAAEIERSVEVEPDPRRRIQVYLAGVGTAVRRHSHAFYDDMVGYEPTAHIYRKNSDAAARRVQELIEDGVRAGVFRAVNGHFAAQVVAVAIDAVQSGALLESAGDAFSELGDQGGVVQGFCPV